MNHQLLAVIIGGIVMGSTLAVILPVYYSQSNPNQTLIGNYLFAGLIIEGIAIFMTDQVIQNKRSQQDKTDVHVRDLVNKIYQKLTTVQLHVLIDNRIQLQVERFDEWSPALAQLPSEALWLPVSHLPEPYLEFALKHLEAYDEINKMWQDIRNQVNEYNSHEVRNDKVSQEWRDSISSHVLPPFKTKLIEFVNDLNAGIPLKGKCRRGL